MLIILQLFVYCKRYNNTHTLKHTIMATFKDLEFTTHPIAESGIERHKGAKWASYYFKNGYGVSVLFGDCFYSNGIDDYELAVMYGDSITYNTDITNDVIGRLSPDQVTEIMIRVSKLEITKTQIEMTKAIKFRASGNGKLMTKGRKKDEVLGQTAKSHIEELFLKKEFGYDEVIQTKEMKKGHLCEGQSRELIQQVLGGSYRKRNTKNFHNEYFTGTPDIILEGEQVIEDIKNSWNLRTFFKADGSDKAYYWQGQTYMELTGAKVFRLIYTLNPIPNELMEDEERKLYYQFGQDELNEDYIAAVKQLFHNNDLINNLKPEQRVKVFTFERDDEAIKSMYDQAKAGIEYYNTL